VKKSVTANCSLSKYIAQAGICARRKATFLIQEGAVKVNGAIVTEPGYKISSDDLIMVYDKVVEHIPQKIYILLNKPKGYITTAADERGRRTVMELFEQEIRTRIYPIGRLDRNTTGLLLLTNDGPLAHKLSHPSSNMRKVYHVTLDKSLTTADFNAIKKGIMLDDGIMHIDIIHFLKSPKAIELEIHSGRYRIIRRLFEALGYQVEKLDRVQYAHLNKKGLSTGSWRYLLPEEIEIFASY
jgi:23S rRNA pseudouridine2605 synthase